jgi:sugar lactone lactonase YvrE
MASTVPARFLFIVVLSAGLAASACGGGPTPPAESTEPAAPPAPAAAPLTAGWKATDGIATPESVYVDEGSGFIFASQIDGAPDARDGNGRIAQLSGDGRVVSANWAAGLNAPKGLRSHNGTLWTADLDEVVGIDIASARVTSRTKIDGALFLNDVAVGPDGTVYVSDMMANRIHAVRNGTATVFAEGEQLEWPNGLLVDGNRLIVGGWGKPKPDFSTDVPGHLFALDLQTKQKTLITPKPFANIDGIERDGRGGYIVSDFVAGKILQVSAAGDARELRTFMPGSADIAFVPAGNVLIVPHMNENMVASYDLSDALK